MPPGNTPVPECLTHMSDDIPGRARRMHAGFPNDLTDAEWMLLSSFLPPPRPVVPEASTSVLFSTACSI